MTLSGWSSIWGATGNHNPVLEFWRLQIKKLALTPSRLTEQHNGRDVNEISAEKILGQNQEAEIPDPFLNEQKEINPKSVNVGCTSTWTSMRQQKHVLPALTLGECLDSGFASPPKGLSCLGFLLFGGWTI